MKVCIFGGTNPATNPKYIENAQKVGDFLVKHNFTKVWGGNAHGVLAEINKKFREAGKEHILVLPEVYSDDLETMEVDKVVMAKSICSRMESMLEQTCGGSIIVMPGGIGTIFEFWAAVECKRAEEFDVDIILFDYDGFYKHQLAHYDYINENGFTRIGQGGSPYRICPTDLFTIAKTPEEVIAAWNNGNYEYRSGRNKHSYPPPEPLP